MEEIVNKVSQSGIVTIDLEEFFVPGERVIFDIKPHLFQELILREKDFRDFIKTNDWTNYKDKFVGIICSSDAIVPTWAYMLIAMAMEPYAKRVFFGTIADIENFLFLEKITAIRPEDYKDARVVIKGCSDKPVPTNAYVQLAALLKPFAKSIMYGEPCSTVPLYKAKAS
ncbi:MAG: DUF2480 family protein [Bacteroidia bacterium]|nr:DUF2480 family protein [Bacteroidia bacterium]